MINMMYLVLTALLALNVSAEILKAFHMVEISMDRAGDNIEKKNVNTLKAIEKYHKEQTRKTQLRNDRNQWERYKSKLPDAPKTLSGFRAMKKANSEKWQNLQGRYRAGI